MGRHLPKVRIGYRDQKPDATCRIEEQDPRQECSMIHGISANCTCQSRQGDFGCCPPRACLKLQWNGQMVVRIEQEGEFTEEKSMSMVAVYKGKGRTWTQG